ncbi:unnamed protein product [Rotaria sordida]|uniref:Uncharacterized protein n=1 Tax=Rotaria sordida TaxID=392033 RepID=A0A815FLT4_9BILA|nr:unnamed protein product [Rotaria sordida]CAF3818767.1 unnamed protein product [Rotaria sordida]CAF3925138.1 unnamed protein product [Rotaria sordida]
MLIEKATNAQSQIQLIPYSGIVNPEHMNQMNCVPTVDTDDNVDDDINHLENLFIEDFIRKSKDFRDNEQINSLPVEIRLGTVYTYQNRRQQNQYPNSLYYRTISAQSLRNEERRPRKDKDFLITFNKNKGINNIQMFEYELTCAGFRSTNDLQLTYRLYLRYQTKRLILELKRNTNDERFFSVKRLLKYSTKYTHIDVVKSKYNTNYPETFDDIFDIRTSIGKVDEEELHINDDYCNFIHIKDLNQCVFETKSNNGDLIYQFNRNLLPYFDFFQIKQTIIYDYSCMDSRFFGLRVLIEHQTGYDLCSSSKTTTPCLETNNVIMAKLLSFDFTEDEAKRIWTIGTWLSDLATQCTNQDLPNNKIVCRRPGQMNSYRHTVR